MPDSNNPVIRIVGQDDAETARMATVLQSLQRAQRSIYHVCGGKGMCTTCRIEILNGAKNCTRPTEAEKEALKRAGLGGMIRLACQTRVMGDIEIDVLLKTESDLKFVLNEERPADDGADKETR